MRHHQPLIAMRRAGAKPAVVDFEVGLYDPNLEHWPDWTPTHARVHLSLADDPKLLDLRFLVGCDVRLMGTDPDDEPKVERRLRQLFEAAIRANANSVVCLQVFEESEVLAWHA